MRKPVASLSILLSLTACCDSSLDFHYTTKPLTITTHSLINNCTNVTWSLTLMNGTQDITSLFTNLNGTGQQIPLQQADLSMTQAMRYNFNLNYNGASSNKGA